MPEPHKMTLVELPRIEIKLYDDGFPTRLIDFRKPERGSSKAWTAFMSDGQRPYPHWTEGEFTDYDRRVLLSCLNLTEGGVAGVDLATAPPERLREIAGGRLNLRRLLIQVFDDCGQSAGRHESWREVGIPEWSELPQPGNVYMAGRCSYIGTTPCETCLGHEERIMSVENYTPEKARELGVVEWQTTSRADGVHTGS
jgi:hypothetical protein